MSNVTTYLQLSIHIWNIAYTIGQQNQDVVWCTLQNTTHNISYHNYSGYFLFKKRANAKHNNSISGLQILPIFQPVHQDQWGSLSYAIVSVPNTFLCRNVALVEQKYRMCANILKIDSPLQHSGTNYTHQMFLLNTIPFPWCWSLQ